MRYALIGPLFLVATLACSANARAPLEVPQQQGGISGQVRDTAGGPMPGVSVIALPASGGSISRATTGRDGRYQLDGLATGAYRVDFDLFAFDLVRRNRVAVQRGPMATVDVALAVSAVCDCVGYVPSVPVRPRSGVVLDTSGRPLPHARLEIVAPDRREIAYADATGQFEVRLPNHPPWPFIVSDTGFRARKLQASRAHATPMVVRLEPGEIHDVPEAETLKRGCRCPGDLFTHEGR